MLSVLRAVDGPLTKLAVSTLNVHQTQPTQMTLSASLVLGVFLVEWGSLCCSFFRLPSSNSLGVRHPMLVLCRRMVRMVGEKLYIILDEGVLASSM